MISLSCCFILIVCNQPSKIQFLTFPIFSDSSQSKFQLNGKRLKILIIALRMKIQTSHFKFYSYTGIIFYRDGKYDLDFKNPNTDKSKWITSDQLGDIYKQFVKDYPVVSIEDPFEQDDWNAWTKLTSSVNIQVNK